MEKDAGISQRQLSQSNWYLLLPPLTACVCDRVKLAVVDSCFHLLSYETPSLLGESFCFI